LARRTKEDARATRASLLDAAEVLFQAQGVSRTSLSDIARHAGTTRGAIYWHFTGKADLFNAMMDRVTLPLEQAFLDHESDPEGSPLHHMRRVMQDALKQISSDERTRRVFEVATQKVEYIGELHAVRTRHLKVRNDFLAHMERNLQLAAAQQNLTIALPLHIAVRGLHAMVDGMIQNWLLDIQAFDLTTAGGLAIDVYLTGLGLTL
jgi:TetR/AcrR family acrAB operon transcriptional repressor